MSPPFGPVALLALAFGLALGLLVDAVGTSGRINILAPPLMGLLAWNMAVYVLLIMSAARPRAVKRPLRDSLVQAVQRLTTRPLPDASCAAAALHAGAATFALGALAALYLRGMALEYRAGWETTFLSADTVQRILSFVLGPASHMTGLPLPSSEELAALHFGLGGENAARWIHLYAVTVLLFVVLPRLLLAAMAMRRAALAARPRPAMPVQVLPYGCRVAPASLHVIEAALERATGRRVAVALREPLPLGAEDELDRLLTATPAALAALFTLSATPEAENHGAFVDSLTARSREPLVVLVDESAFIRRFTGADGSRRREERRRAWLDVMQARGMTPLFVNLAP